MNVSIFGGSCANWQNWYFPSRPSWPESRLTTTKSSFPLQRSHATHEAHAMSSYATVRISLNWRWPTSVSTVDTDDAEAIEVMKQEQLARAFETYKGEICAQIISWRAWVVKVFSIVYVDTSLRSKNQERVMLIGWGSLLSNWSLESNFQVAYVWSPWWPSNLGIAFRCSMVISFRYRRMQVMINTTGHGSHFSRESGKHEGWRS